MLIGIEMRLSVPARYEKCVGQLSFPICHGEKGSSDTGYCFVPRTRPCKYASWCRPGSTCAPGPDGPVRWTKKTCEECPTGTSQTALCVEIACADAIDRWAYKNRDYNDSDIYSFSTDMRRAAAANTVRLVESASKTSVTDAVGEELGLFRASIQGLVPQTEDSSRSGAKFFFTADGKYLVKGFDRESEYDSLLEIQRDIIDLKAGWSLTKANDTQTRRETTLNVAVLAFSAFGSSISDPVYWLVMKNAGARFQEQLECGPPIHRFDAKPMRLISDDRADLLQTLRKIDFRPFQDDRFNHFFGALDQDLTYFVRKSLVDYSWLIYIFDVPYYQPMPSEGFCFPVFKQVKLVGRNDTGTIKVVCFSLIDYSLTFDGLGMRIESAVMKDKWLNYGSQFHKFSYCLMHLYSPPETLEMMYRVEEITLTFPRPKERIGELRIASGIKANFGNNLFDSCDHYRRAACEGLILEVNVTHYTPTPVPFEATCDFKFYESETWDVEAFFCLSILAQTCHSEMISKQSWLF
eukprot:TRINITY_DN29880_c0_g1_i5.p1 TRINITY_DN29880_c0_g1~~TRINITY_DN29880_c0_g1_i5.p1  ORF type:complete len:522 (+),score=67.30 TRINITY_DN29880_c0_g1_i5:102-1667(+)